MKKLLRGGRVIDPANGIDGMFDLLIEGDRIAQVGRDLPIGDLPGMGYFSPCARCSSSMLTVSSARLEARFHLATHVTERTDTT